MEIKSLANTDFGTLATAFGAAFARYEVQITPDELHTMLRRRGFDPALSFAAFNGDGSIMGFTLNGIGTFGDRNAHGGVPTAYDTGTGTLPEYRGQGLAAQIFEASIPHLQAAGIKQYLLEVLQHNTAAVSVYRRLGFEVSREFNYFRAESGDVQIGNCVNCAYPIRQVAPAELRETAAEFWDFEPSWQNSFEAIERAADDFIAFGAFDGDGLVGYVIFEPTAGDITQIAVAKNHRRKGVGSALLGEMLRQNHATGVKCLNTEIGRDESLAVFLQSKNIPLAGRQFEMIKSLRGK
jgi:ribosomal protein S18 acetylase RimI-like enzyme